MVTNTDSSVQEPCHKRLISLQNLNILLRCAPKWTLKNSYYGDMQQLATSLERNEPCIAFVMTGELPYWDFSTPHAVVVVGLDQESVYLNDPVEEVAPQVVTRTQFELAWLDFDYYYALIRRR